MNHSLSHLKRDPVMRRLIDKYGPIEHTHTPDLFPDILNTIISQQLSTRVADVIWERFLLAIPSAVEGSPKPKSKPGDFSTTVETTPKPLAHLTPTNVISTPDSTIRSCGISYSKISYLKNFSSAILNGKIDLTKLLNLTDDQVISELTRIKGIGPWTAEMILMFSMNRPDVFSLGDLGLRTAISHLYSIPRDDLKSIQQLSLRWSPYRTLASRYLWKSLDNKP